MSSFAAMGRSGLGRVFYSLPALSSIALFAILLPSASLASLNECRFETRLHGELAWPGPDENPILRISSPDGATQATEPTQAIELEGRIDLELVADSGSGANRSWRAELPTSIGAGDPEAWRAELISDRVWSKPRPLPELCGSSPSPATLHLLPAGILTAEIDAELDAELLREHEELRAHDIFFEPAIPVELRFELAPEQGKESAWSAYSEGIGRPSRPAGRAAALPARCTVALLESAALLESVTPLQTATPTDTKAAQSDSTAVPADSTAVPADSTVAPTDSARTAAGKNALLRCTLPAARLDARIEADGYAPHYAWEVLIEPGQTTHLGQISFVPGASLAGWVELDSSAEALASGTEAGADPSTEAPATTVRLSLQLTGWMGDPAQKRRIASRAHEVRADERGFFQLRGLPADLFELTASRPGHADARFESIRLEEGREHSLAEPLRLGPPIYLEAFVDPPVDSRGRPWRLELLRTQPGTDVARALARSDAGTNGYWRSPSVPGGPASLGVYDQDENNWWQGQVEVEADLPAVQIEIGAVAVAGTIHFDDEPLETELIFGSRQRRPNVRVRSDAEGRFEGVLPRPGEWPLEVLVDGAPVEIEAVEVQGSPGDPAWLEIVVATTELHGRIFEGGEPAAGATLVVRNEEGGNGRAGQLTDEHGRVTVRGLPPGRYAVAAYWRGRTSAPVRVELEEGVDLREIRLDIQPETRVRGRVSYQGRGLAGAKVWLFSSSEERYAQYGESVSDSLGRFETGIPEGFDAVSVITVGRGLGSVIERRSLEGGENEMSIELGLDRGDLLFQVPGFADSFLVHAGASIPLRPLLGTVLVPDSEQSAFVLPSMRPGRYSLCPTRIPGPECQAGELTPNGSWTFR